jgi:hypothetical protein
MDVIVKVSPLPVGADKPPTIRVTQGWLRVSHRAENSELAAEIRVSQLQNSPKLLIVRKHLSRGPNGTAPPPYSWQDRRRC